MKYYHGSKSIVKEPSFDYKLASEKKDPKNHMATDFGKGLYLCYDKKEAVGWALAPKYSKENPDGMIGKGFLMAYELHEDDLIVKEIPEDRPGVYLLFLLNNMYTTGSQEDNILSMVSRKDKEIYQDIMSGFDVLKGPRLDSRYVSIKNDALSGRLTLKEFGDLCKLGDLGKQVYLNTDKAYKSIECLYTRYLDDMDYANEYMTKLYNAKFEHKFRK